MKKKKNCIRYPCRARVIELLESIDSSSSSRLVYNFIKFDHVFNRAWRLRVSLFFFHRPLRLIIKLLNCTKLFDKKKNWNLDRVSCFLKRKKKDKKKKKKTKYKSYRIVELKKMAYHQFDNKMWKFKNLNGKGGGRKGGRGDEVNRSTSKVMMQA